jgi:hypothetical protein
MIWVEPLAGLPCFNRSDGSNGLLAVRRTHQGWEGKRPSLCTPSKPFGMFAGVHNAKNLFMIVNPLGKLSIREFPGVFYLNTFIEIEECARISG